jgi:membrane associated rhomboid family serine protease
MSFNPEPRRSSGPFLLLPWPVVVLVGLLAACYAAFVLAPPGLQADILYRFAFIPSDYSSGRIDGHAAGLLALAVPFVTYVFLHGSLSHLAINSIWMLPFGAVVARRYHAGLFFLFFFLCGAAGAATHMALNWGSGLAVIGASGAISGLMGAGFRMLGPAITVTGREPGPHQPLAPIFSPRIVVWTLIWVAINIFAGVTGLGTGPQVRLIAWQAHLGGYFAGLFLAGPFAALAAGLEPRGRAPR